MRPERTRKGPEVALLSTGQLSPQVLIVSNRYDFGTDYVAARLMDAGVPYFRLNVEDLPALRVFLDPVVPSLTVESGAGACVVSETSLVSLYFRQPVFLRECSGKTRSLQEQFMRSQWAAFMRSLMVFQGAFWVNHPRATYVAESKPVQIALARQVGLDIPPTLVANAVPRGPGSFLSRDRELVAKTLDTVVLTSGDSDAFIYTSVVRRDELSDARLSSAPVVLQKLLEPKVDVRVTVVGKKVFAAKILRDGKGIAGDWRLYKDHVSFTPIELPAGVRESCITLVARLGLVFGAIDLAVAEDKWFFLEINPTGEWAWLTAQLGLPIDLAIATVLTKGGEATAN